NVGKYSFGIKSLCLTMLIFGCSTLSHVGMCPHVTKCILFTHEAYFSIPLNKYCKLFQSLYLNPLLSVLMPGEYLLFSFRHSGSFPSTQHITKSIKLL